MSERRPAISIVTPSYNMLDYIKLCSASIADQNVDYEHVIIDGGSRDGTVQWLNDSKNIIYVSEKDNGMYNALNKAIDMSRGEIVGHLNCDEQYLPGVLKFVVDFFNGHPNVDFIAADFLIIDPQGEFVAYRKSFQPRWQYFFSNYMYTTTATLFYRRKVFAACRFNESYRSIADAIFLYDVMRRGFKGIHVQKFFSVFTFSGNNLSLQPISAIEKARFKKTLPSWYKALKPLFAVFFYIERLLNNTVSQVSPLAYSIFTKDDLYKRKEFVKVNPGYRLKFVRRSQR